MTGVCQATLPFLSSVWTWLGIAGLGIAGKLAYSYSSLSFWPSFLAFSSIIRILGGISSILNLAWKANVFVVLALFTTFSDTIRVALGGNKPSLRELLFSAGSDIYNKVGFAVQHLVDSLGYLAEWVSISTSKGFCAGLGSTEILVSALASFWVGLAAYIFAIRIYDWMYGKGMTREIEWPELMLVVIVVTLVSLVIVGTSSVVEGLSNGEMLWNSLNGSGNVSVNGS